MTDRERRRRRSGRVSAAERELDVKTICAVVRQLRRTGEIDVRRRRREQRRRFDRAQRRRKVVEGALTARRDEHRTGPAVDPEPDFRERRRSVHAAADEHVIAVRRQYRGVGFAARRLPMERYRVADARIGPGRLRGRPERAERSRTHTQQRLRGRRRVERLHVDRAADGVRSGEGSPAVK